MREYCTFEWNGKELLLHYYEGEEHKAINYFSLEEIKAIIRINSTLKGYTPQFKEIFPITCDWLKEQGILEE